MHHYETLLKLKINFSTIGLSSFKCTIFIRFFWNIFIYTHTLTHKLFCFYIMYEILIYNRMTQDKATLKLTRKYKLTKDNIFFIFFLFFFCFQHKITIYFKCINRARIFEIPICL